MVTVRLYVRVAPGRTVPDSAVFTTDRSENLGPCTVVVVVELLLFGFGSGFPPVVLTLAVFAIIVPSATCPPTRPVMLMVTVPWAKFGVLMVMVPFVPNAGSVRFQPCGALEALTKVSSPGKASVTVTLEAAEGPELVIVKV